jgi:transcriptional regulator with XRE-family HTH domain
MPPAPYATILTSNMRAARAAAQLSQADVGERMRELGFTSWLRQTMSTVENGKRRLTAEEVFALAFVLETTIARLVTPTADSPDFIAFPSGQSMHVSAVVGSARGARVEALRWDGNKPVFTGTSYPAQFRDLVDPDAVDPRVAAFTAAERAIGGPA